MSRDGTAVFLICLFSLCLSGSAVAMDGSSSGSKASGGEVVIPAAASLAGAYDTQWESDFRFFNPCWYEVEVHIEFQPDNTDNVGATLVSRDLSISEKHTKVYFDIFDLLPDLGGGEVSGALRIQSSSTGGCSVIVVSRTFNDTPDGTLGLTVPAMTVGTPEETLLEFPGLIHNDGYRTNLRLVNFSDSTEWGRVTAIDENGHQVGDGRSAKVFGQSTKQVNGLAEWLGVGSDLAPFTARVEANGREIQAVATVVDNITGDSVLYTSLFADVDRLWLAGAASLSGVNESQWRTDLWLYNPTDGELAGDSEFYDGNDPDESYLFGWPTLEPNSTYSYLDLVSDELGLEETRGYVVLTGDGGSAPQVAARTYNLDPVAGTYGLNLRAYRSEDLLYPGESGFIAGISNSPDVVDFDYGFRTNVGLLNTDPDSWTTVQLTMYDVGGSTAADIYETTIAPGKLRQFNVFDKLGLGNQEMHGSLRVDVIKGGAVAVYATEIDNRTQDSIFITAQRADFGDDCRFIIEPAYASFDASGGSGSFDVVTGAECAWEARSTQSWVTVTEVDNRDRVGSGTVHYAVHANSGEAREARIRAGSSFFYLSQDAPPSEITVSLSNDVSMELVYVPPGTFQMGSPTSERGRASWESLHDVTLTKGYYLGKYEVTQAQWVALMGSNPSVLEGIGDNYPVYYVTWDEIAGTDGFLERLNDHLESTGQAGAGAFRLPTEAEWERAARADTQTRFSFGDALECADDSCDSCAIMDQNVWWCGNTDDHAEPVGTKPANAFGLHDMHGNLAEWTQDIWREDLGTDPQTDPVGEGDEVRKTIKHGSYYNPPGFMRPAYRNGGYPNSGGRTTGFRVARSLAPPVKITTCGQAVVTDAVLDDDLVCDQIGSGEVAVQVGASNITVDLKGHTISGDPNNGIAFAVWWVDGVTIRNGTIEDFLWGIDVLGGRDFVFEDLTYRNLKSDHWKDNVRGIQTFRTNNLIVRNSVFELFPQTHKQAVLLYGDKDFLIDSIETYSGAGGVRLSCIPGALYEGNSGTVTNSYFEGGTIEGVAVHCSQNARIADNVFVDNATHMAVDPPQPDLVTGLIVEGNLITEGFVGVHLWGSTDVTVRYNEIHDTWDGIFLGRNILCPDPPTSDCFYATGNTISENVVTDNAVRDLYHEPNATGNTWVDNVCEMWEGDEIPGCIAP
jgi:formylglycine-generating enzyme required for sulfatase activity